MVRLAHFPSILLFSDRFVEIVMFVAVVSFVTLMFPVQVSRLRILGDHLHSTRIAFVEFVEVNCVILLQFLCLMFLCTRLA